MASDSSKKAWGLFESNIQRLAGELKRHYRDTADGGRSAELNSSLEQLRAAAESVFKSLETATQDAELRSKTRETARSFGSAVAETFREVSDEIEKRVKKA
jgi:hypothetical protein